MGPLWVAYGDRVRGVLLAGGTGSRLYPLTRITNKHLLPVYDRPMVQWAVESVVNAGVTELMVVTGGTHAGEFLRLLGNGHEYGIDLLCYGYQERPGGIAEALGLAERFADGQPVLVMLADNVVGGSIATMVEAFRAKPEGGRILLTPVSEPKHLRHLGVPELDETGRVVRIWEKPEDPPSSYGVTGIYCYDAGVFDVIRTLEPSGRGELEITDVNNHYVDEGRMAYDVLEGFWGDAGESIEAYHQVNDYVRRERRQSRLSRGAVNDRRCGAGATDGRSPRSPARRARRRRGSRRPHLGPRIAGACRAPSPRGRGVRPPSPAGSAGRR